MTDTEPETAPSPRFVGEALGILFPPTPDRWLHVDDLDEQQRGQVHRLAVVLADHDEEKQRLQKFAQILMDLDRNENGRHEGDADVGDPTGISQGNFRTGQLLGYGLGGSVRYVMPERGRRHDPDAWVVRQ